MATTHNSDGYDSSFINALDVAHAAARLHEQAERVNVKAERLAHLTQRAREEVEQLSDLATELAMTAACIAGMTVGASTEESLRVAYSENQESCRQKMSLQNFLDVIAAGVQQYAIEHRNPGPSSQQWETRK